LVDGVHAANLPRAEAEGISMQDAATRAVREYGSPGSAPDQAAVATLVSATRRALGDADFEAAWDIARQLSAGEVVAFALAAKR
jgi:hypothetical protein